MDLRFQQIDAFAERAFGGNPAAVVWVEDWPTDEVMAAIAAENNLSETAFVLRGADAVHLRWFTPTVEVDLCGHATLAAGFGELSARPEVTEVTFQTRSGPLVVRRVRDGSPLTPDPSGGEIEMELPAIRPFEATPPAEVIEALGSAPSEVLAMRKVHHADYWLARYASVAAIDALAPDIARLGALRCNVLCTAEGEGEADFVSRFFAPASGVAEDPVTGSAHCSLAPFWAERLQKNPLRAHQRSKRGGWLTCEVRGDRVALRGRCVRVIEGTLTC